MTQSEFVNLFGKDAAQVHSGQAFFRNNTFRDCFKDGVDFDGGAGENIAVFSGNVVGVELCQVRERLKGRNAELSAALVRLHLLATRDELTGLPNRRQTHECLVREAARIGRRQGIACLCLIDLDRWHAMLADRDWRATLETKGDPVMQETLRVHLGTGRALGDPDWIARMEANLGRRLRDSEDLGAARELVLARVRPIVLPSRAWALGWIAAAGAVMATINTIDLAADAYRWGLGAAQWPFRALLAGEWVALVPVRLWMDPSDLATLPALAAPLALSWGRGPVARDQPASLQPTSAPVAMHAGRLGSCSVCIVEWAGSSSTYPAKRKAVESVVDSGLHRTTIWHP